jgi:hypothetical protein
MSIIRFCLSPLRPEHLKEDYDLRVFREHAFVCAAMGEHLWSFDELLEQCRHHEVYAQPPALAQAVIALMQVGMICTEESLFLEESVTRMERALQSASTFEDIEWGAAQLAVRMGGPGHQWAISVIAHGLSKVMTDVSNCLETVYSCKETDEQFVVTITRKDGKTPMDLRRDILDELGDLVRNGGASAQQLQAIIDAAKPNPHARGLATPPKEEPFPWIRFQGDHVQCFRCMKREKIVFPCNDPMAIVNAFGDVHQRCKPSEVGTGQTILAIKSGELARDNIADDNSDG